MTASSQPRHQPQPPCAARATVTGIPLVPITLTLAPDVIGHLMKMATQKGIRPDQVVARLLIDQAVLAEMSIDPTAPEEPPGQRDSDRR